ncbi:hypothetical protein CsSME_00004171 [Camellia sinensis var. sinensis]
MAVCFSTSCPVPCSDISHCREISYTIFKYSSTSCPNGRGISDEALELSDLRCSIPMNGMVDSFNVSVAAGILMHHAVCDRTTRLTLGIGGVLPPRFRDRNLLCANNSLEPSDWGKLLELTMVHLWETSCRGPAYH